YSRYRIKNKSVKVIQQQKEAIEEKSKENELLVREIHHRVKNNLQIILSLLNARSSSDIDKTSIEDFIGESQNRIKSMALVHQDLYLSESLVQVDSMSYLQKLLDNIKRSYLCDKENIEFRTNIIDERISMRLAVPIGLIVNELVTNSCKYAFCNESPDKVVTVNFSKSSKDAAYQLEVFDNGNGLPKNIDLKAMNSFGLQMVRGLVDQLNGSLEIIKKGGTGYNILVNS
ncbi:MAG: sensor histidine kinase, partial [Bacteroidota bacterium]